MGGVAVEQPREPAGDRVSAAAPVLGVRHAVEVAKVSGQRTAPGFGARGVDHLEQWPCRGVRCPRVVILSTAEAARRLLEQPGR